MGLRTVGNPAFLGRTPGPTQGPRDPDGTHTPECVPSVPQTGAVGGNDRTVEAPQAGANVGNKER